MKCSGWKIGAVLIAMAAGYAVAESRKWADTSGKFSVDAELVEVRDGKAVLRREDGKQLQVPLERLSEADRAFIEKNSKEAAAGEKPADLIAQIAQRFYEDLRNKERDTAQQMLTKKAKEVMGRGRAPLAGLPQPESGERAVRTGKVQIDEHVAEIPVWVAADGRTHKTKLHLRHEADQWCVFALSATYPDGERSINFEAAGGEQPNVDPLQAIVGKPFDLQGYTLSGEPIDVANFRGKVVLVDFWATWCGPCRAEIPNILANWNEHHDKGFEVIAVSVDQDLKVLAEFVDAEKPPWTVVADNHPRNKKSMAAKYGIRGIPAFVLLGPDGKVAAVHCRGPRLAEQVQKLINTGG